MTIAEGGLEGVAQRQSLETERRDGVLSSSNETNPTLLIQAQIRAGMELFKLLQKIFYFTF